MIIKKTEYAMMQEHIASQAEKIAGLKQQLIDKEVALLEAVSISTRTGELCAKLYNKLEEDKSAIEHINKCFGNKDHNRCPVCKKLLINGNQKVS